MITGSSFEGVSERDTPIWFRPEFMNLQPVNVLFHSNSNGLSIPFILGNQKVSVGYIGPHAMAWSHQLPLASQQLFTDAWSQFISEHPKLSIEVRLPPMSLYPAQVARNLEALNTLGFEVTCSDVNQAIFLPGASAAFNRNRRRDLSLCLASGLRFLRVSLEDAHEVIALNRARKGIPLSLGIRELSGLEGYSPEVLQCFGVAKGGELLSASIVFAESRDVRYVFMWGENPSKELGGPSLALLASGLFEESSNSGFRILSLGTSSVGGSENQGLVSFKRSLGAYSEPRLVLTRGATGGQSAQAQLLNFPR